MIQNTVQISQSNIFATPPSKKLVSPKSISRKPNFLNFSKKKSNEIPQSRSSNRMRFISPSKANLFINQQTIDPKDSFNFNYTEYAGNQTINYPFIKRCVSPKHFHQITYTRKNSINSTSRDQSSFFTSILSPSIQDFGNCDITTEIGKKDLHQQKISELKKQNFELNILLDEKNQIILNQKQQYDSKLVELAHQLSIIRKSMENSEKIITETQQKLSISQNKYKDLCVKLENTNEKLDKATKQIKMYKAKYKVNFTTGKQKQDSKNKKYHQNCCKGDQNSKKYTKNHQNNCNKLNALGQSRKISSNSGLVLKKIKSQNILSMCNVNTSVDPSPQASRLMKIHSNDEQFNEYSSLKVQIQNLSNQIRYKDIEILTLKKKRSEFESQKQNYQKVKKFNKKLLARVQFLTKQCDDLQAKKRISLPLSGTPRKCVVEVTPKKKFKFQYEDFSDQQQSQQTIQLFQLSPQKYLCEINKSDELIVQQISSF